QRPSPPLRPEAGPERSHAGRRRRARRRGRHRTRAQAAGAARAAGPPGGGRLPPRSRRRRAANAPTPPLRRLATFGLTSCKFTVCSCFGLKRRKSQGWDLRRADGAGGRIGDGVDELLDIAPGDVGHLAFRSAERDALLIALSSNPGGLNVKTAGY